MDVSTKLCMESIAFGKAGSRCVGARYVNQETKFLMTNSGLIMKGYFDGQLENCKYFRAYRH